MDRWASAAFGIVVVAATAVLILRVDRQASPSPATVDPSPVSLSTSSAPLPLIETKPDTGPAVSDSDVTESPPLPDDAPHSIQLGVIQFPYRGAERAPRDAPTKQEALERALSAIPAAREDFAATVSKGDAGSSADLGRVPRGVLEPDIEHVVFTLEPGEVHGEPLDTPRGYWIVRRTR